MDKDKPPPFPPTPTVEEKLQDLLRRRALTEKEHREREKSPVSSHGSSNESISNFEDDEDDYDGDDADDEMDEEETEDESDDGMHEEIETKDDAMEEEDDEENREAFCRACGDNDGAAEFWIFCNICNKRFHGQCDRFTPAMAAERNKCPLCRARP